MNHREMTKRIMVGNVPVGGGAPIVVQSMTSTFTKDVKSTIKQIKRLERAGCEIVRVAVPDVESARAIAEIKKQIRIPIIADIHFNYKLGIEAIKMGADGLRINPGNIGAKDRIKAIVDSAKEHKIPIRIGINSGSIEEEILKKYSCGVTSEALAESAIRNVRILEDMGFNDIKISVKSSDVLTTVNAYRLVAKSLNYPLHLGVTEAGTLVRGVIKSSVGMGILLAEGIGDTIRISLTADPVEEVKAGYILLSALNLRQRGITLISCPTCGRAEVDVLKIAREFEKRVGNVQVPLKVAIMGCVVNGPGEAKEADIGIAGGKKSGILFRRGKILKKIKEKEMVDILITEINNLIKEKR